jgi:FkbM family methyltransferase
MNRSLRAECNGEYWLLSLLPPTPLIVDVGFNEGRFSLEALRQRPEARIIGFEPARSMQRKVTATLAHECRIELLPFAVSNGRMELDFCDSSDGCSSLVGGQPLGGEKYRVQTIRLDDFADERGYSKIEMLKIDAEGYDLPALEGAERLLDRQAIDVFLFEYNTTWIGSRCFLRDAWVFLEDKPYVLFRLFNGFLASFRYGPHAERHDLGCIYVGVSRSRLGEGGIPTREFPQ